MKQFEAPFITADIQDEDLARLSALLDLQEEQHIDNLPWGGNGCRPQVSFCMAYTTNSVLLKYSVKEQYLKAVYRQINDPVYKDSCVEAFIAFNNESNYYNLEFNCLGTALAGYGSGRDDRTLVKKQLVETIKNHHQIKSPATAHNELIEWELTLNIPFALFEHHDITSLKNQVCNVNFYKCGDELPEPHFLSWNNIIYPEPNFHLPEFFGKVKFV
jgi:hypothetical protein